MDYSKYKFTDLLSDDYFIDSIKNPTIESEKNWEELIENNQISITEFKRAKLFLETIDVSKSELTDMELLALYNEIEILTVEKRKKVTLKRKFVLLGSIASLIAILLISFNLFNQKKIVSNTNIISAAESLKVNTTTENVSLKVSEQKEIVIQEDEARIEYTQEGSLQINDTDKPIDDGEKSIYNQLWVPKGKRSTLLLSDGTKVWLNAGTRVIYPTTFTDNVREIYVDGEIFLEVTKDTNKPFIVSTKNINVTVLGTSFDVKAYESEDAASVILVEGSVVVNAQGEVKTLSPDDMLLFQDKNINIEKVDTEFYTSWRTGSYRFRSQHLSQVLKLLSDYYGVRINYDQETGSLICSGKLNLRNDITQILDGLSKMLNLRWEHRGGEYVLMRNH